MRARWISRTLILCAASMLALPVASSATSRVRGLAVQGDYVKDYTGIYTYISGVTNVGNLVYGELGDLNKFSADPATASPLDRSVGAVMGNLWDGRLGTWAIHLRQFTPQLGQGQRDTLANPAPGAFGEDPNFHTNETFDIMWGKKFGTTSVGLRLNRSFTSVEGDLTDLPGFGAFTTLKYDVNPSTAPSEAYANTHRNVLGFGGGLGFEMNPNTSGEVALLYQSRTFEVTSPAEKIEDDGAASYQLAARVMWQWQPNVVVTPVFKWYSYDLSTKSSIGGSADNSLKGWQIGAAGNWTLGQNDLFVLGLTFAENKAEQESGVITPPSPFTPFAVTDGTITETIAPSSSRRSRPM